MRIRRNRKVLGALLALGLTAIVFTLGFSYGDGFFGRGWDYVRMGSGTDGVMGVYNSGNGVGLGVRADNNDAIWCNGSATFDGQIASTVATGTPPITVASSSPCPNLNADKVDGYHASSSNPADYQLARRWFWYIPPGGTSTTFKIPAYNVCTVTIGEAYGSPQEVAFLHIVENDGQIAYSGQNSTGVAIYGTASLYSVTPIVTLAGGNIVLQTPGDGSLELDVTSTGLDVRGMTVW